MRTKKLIYLLICLSIISCDKENERIDITETEI